VFYIEAVKTYNDSKRRIETFLMLQPKLSSTDSIDEDVKSARRESKPPPPSELFV